MRYGSSDMDLLEGVMKKSPADEGAGTDFSVDKVSENFWNEQVLDVEYFGTPSEAVSLEIVPIYYHCEL